MRDYILKTAPRDHDHTQVKNNVKIMEARLFIRTRLFSPSLIVEQEMVMQSKMNSIHFNKLITKTLSIPTNTSQIEIDNVYHAKLPEVVI